MKYIELKLLKGLAKRKSVVHMGGFELVCKNQYDNGRDIIRKGQISGDFKLSIGVDGLCRVPDTKFNRKVLLVQCFEHEEKVHGVAITMPPVFELLSKIDLNEAAPRSGQEKYSQADVDALEAKIIELQENNEKVVKKAKTKTKVKVSKKEPTEDVTADVEPDLV